MEESMETQIQNLGEGKIDFPFPNYNFVDDSCRVLYDVSENYFIDCVKNNRAPITFELAGPRSKIYFDPKKLKCAIVTCGGLCPGLNDVIRGIVMALYHMYGVRNIFGIRYGYEGFIPRCGHDMIELSPAQVDGIHDIGGTILGSSRGHQEIGEIVDAIERLNLGILFTIGGDGTLTAAELIDREMRTRQLKCAVVGIPKTIDNDIRLAARSFGFDTAVEEATKVIGSAHVESKGAPNGIGLVKLMGRHAGFIAATAALAQPDVNVVLIPESDFDLEGENGLFRHLRERLEERGHVVVVAAEGAGQRYFKERDKKVDRSGNVKYGDIGMFLQKEIERYFKKIKKPISLKYINPSYTIRSVPANSNDSIFCNFLAYNAVHGGMAGKTGFMVSTWNNNYTYVPIKEAIVSKKQINLKEKLWVHVLESTGQPSLKN